MTISTIRRATDDDLAAVEASAERFCARHGITAYEGKTFEECVELAIDTFDPYDFKARKLRQLWIACYCRALGQPRDHRLTIGWGHVGLRID